MGLIRDWRASGLTVGFTNGCFDLLHVGHLATLAYASRQADRLAVGIDDDAAVRRLKGSGRPIVSAEQRALIVSVIRRVDVVAIFAANELEPLIAAIRPDVMIKGEDYRGRPIIGREHAKRIAYAPMVDGLSTTELIRRVSCVMS